MFKYPKIRYQIRDWGLGGVQFRKVNKYKRTPYVFERARDFRGLVSSRTNIVGANTHTRGGGVLRTINTIDAACVARHSFGDKSVGKRPFETVSQFPANDAVPGSVWPRATYDERNNGHYLPSRRALVLSSYDRVNFWTHLGRLAKASPRRASVSPKKCQRRRPKRRRRRTDRCA